MGELGEFGLSINLSTTGIVKVADAAARALLTPADGDPVVQLDNGHIYVWNDASGTWIDSGPYVETDPVWAAWLAGPPNVSEFTNDVGYLSAETDPLSLHIDQTAQQTVVNGPPLFDEGTESNRGHLVIYDDHDGFTQRSAAADYSQVSVGVNTTSGYVYVQSNKVNAGVVQPLAFFLGATEEARLTATDFDIYSNNLKTSGQVKSTIATGTPPFTIASVTVNANLNADLLDGNHAAAFEPTLTPGAITGTANRLGVTGGAASTVGPAVSLNIDTSLLPSPVLADIGKALIATAANVAAWTTISTADEKLKVSAADTTASYLNSKITVAGSLNKAIGTPAGNETLDLSLTTGTLSAGSAKITIGGTAVGAVLGAGASIDLGTVTLDNLSDVIITTPAADEVLAYNGAEWVNASAGAVSAGPGVEFFLDDTDIITGPTDPTSIHTLSKTPSAGIEVIDSIVVNSNTLLKEMYLYNAAIGGATIDAGIWNFETFCAVNNAANVSEILINVAKVVLKAGTVTTTGGPGTATRTVSASGTPFVAGDANANLASCSYLQTPSGIFPITAFASTASVTITVPTTYTDEGPVAFSIHYKLFQATTGDINSTSVLLYSTQTVQASFAIGATDKLSTFYFGKTTRTANTTISFYHGGSAHYSHFTSPLVIRHNDLSGLQGGSASERYHLTSAQHTIATQAATTAVAGYLTDTDWDTFNNKAPTASPNFTTQVTFGNYFMNPSEVDDGDSAAADTIDFATGSAHRSKATGNCTYTFSNPVTGGSYVLKIVNDGTLRTITWPVTVLWGIEGAPVLTGTSNKVDLINFYWDGTSYYGSYKLGY